MAKDRRFDKALTLGFLKPPCSTSASDAQQIPNAVKGLSLVTALDIDMESLFMKFDP